MKNILQKKALIIFILTISITFYLGNQSSLAVGVKPLTLSLKLNPGSSTNFKIHLIPSEKKELVKLSYYNLIQQNDGSLAYEKYKKNKDSAINWIKLSQKSVEITPGEEKVIEGGINIPFDAGGSYPIIIMVEPQSMQKQNGFNFLVRYAIRINVRVNRPGLYPSVKFSKWGIVKNDEKEPIINVQIHNISSLDLPVSGKAIIRDSQRRLVEQIKLQPPVNLNRNKESIRIYPGSKVKFIGPISHKLEPGTYTLRVFFRYGEHGQIIKSKEITIKEGQYNFLQADKIGAFSVEPKTLELKLKPGQRKTVPLKLNSEIGDKSHIVISGKEIEKKYEYSMLNWMKIMGRKQFDLPGRRPGRSVVTFVVPRDAKDASYHGNVVLQAYDPETKKMIDQKKVPVSIVVGDNQKQNIKFRSLGYLKEDNGYLLSLDLDNTGNIQLSPKAELTITDQKDEFVERLNLSLPETVQKIIPLKSQQLTGLARKLSSGKYKIKIKVLNKNNKEVKTFNKSLEIK